MSYRRRGYRNGSRQQDGYLRNLRYETPKEGIGKLLEKLGEWGGAATGLAAANALARQGIPVPPVVLAGSGLVLGYVSGVLAKAAVNATFDTLKARRAGVAGAEPASVGSLATEIEQIIARLERNHQGLVGVMDRIGTNHAWLITVITGASPALVQQVNGKLTGARRSVEDACTLLRQSKDNLRRYLRAI
ncbi:hypothetical protein ABT346_13925 [Micromonospora peucetia]|uniref:hypothetical protein n=1 Tax=Micromonospora peucetia TaxID=47871 RepID=UPI00332325DC